MSLEGRIRDLGLHEVGQLLALSRKSGILCVSSVLHNASAWIRFVDGAIVDADVGEPCAAGSATAPALEGKRAAVEERVLDTLAWREGRFDFRPEESRAGAASCVRIPTELMLVESMRREDAWTELRDLIPNADVVPSFVDVEPKSLPLLRLVPQEWEVLTRVDGERDLRMLAQLLQRDLLEVVAIVHGLVRSGLLTVRDAAAARRPLADARFLGLDGPVEPAPAPIAEVSFPAPLDDPAADLSVESVPYDPDELWIPESAEMAVFATDGDDDDEVFDPPQLFQGGVTPVAHWHVANEGAQPSVQQREPSLMQSPAAPVPSLREEGDVAARRGDFETALTCWSGHLRQSPGADADGVREAIGLAARLQALLYPTAVQ